jgi:DNA-binding PadR family transcriptional regulator
VAHANRGFATFALEQLALGLLLRGPEHGYQLYQDYLATLAPIWTVGRSKFYAALASLHDQGLLTVHTEVVADRPPRKVYDVTPAGRALFLDWVYRPVTPMRAVRVELLAKLRFFDLLALPEPARLLDAQVEVCRAALGAWADEGASANPDDPFLNLVYDFRRRQAHFILEWLQVCRTHLAVQT